MTYRVIQKNGNNHYLYEVTATWDPESKKSVQKRKYLGKCDADGNLASPKQTMRSMEFGKHYALFHILKRTGLMDRLEDVFGKDVAGILSSYGVLAAECHAPIPDLPGLMEQTPVAKMIGTRATDIRQLRAILSDNCSHLPQLFDRMVEGEIVVFAVDHVPVPFQMRWRFVTENDCGYVYTPEFTTYIGVLEGTWQLCFYKRVYERISTAETMVRIENELKSRGATGVSFVLDHKKGNRSVISDMIAKGLYFICPIYPDSELGREVFGRKTDVLNTEEETGMLYGELCKHSETSLSVGKENVRMLSFLNVTRYQNEMRILYSRCKDMEKRISSITASDARISCFDEFRDVVPFYDIHESEDGTIHFMQRKERFDEYERTCGKTVFLTNASMPARSIPAMEIGHSWLDLEMYEQRRSLPALSMMFGTYAEAESIMLVEFVSMAIRMHIHGILQDTESRDHTVQDVIDSLEGMIAIENKGVWQSCTLTDRHIEALEVLGLEAPSDNDINHTLSR